ncbi:hypothetical protein O181_002555 [Austropuccinia psidii MF-1]|uniref:Uncharacterized protein n=1 Tax=Austropuccinia psidii MF-1 TaxID=1389203 RepID=A0A9Q3BD91_9BASI|nr:hypothetical protein [Austropuccinia psidii MF-1]
MEENIQSNQMYLDREEASPGQDLESLPQERHVWRMPEFSRIPQDQKNELETTPSLEKEGPVASTSSKPATEMSKDKLKEPQKKQKGPKNHQSKCTGKVNSHRPYPQEYRITKLEPSAFESVVNMARTLMEFTAKEK